LDPNPPFEAKDPAARVWPRLFGTGAGGPPPVVFDPAVEFSAEPPGRAGLGRALAAAFLIRLTGPGHALAVPAEKILALCAEDPGWRVPASLFREALRFVPADISRASADPRFARALGRLVASLSGGYSSGLQEILWGVFFPEGVGIRGHEGPKVRELRRARSVRIEAINPVPLDDPLRRILFTANVLLAPPPEGSDPGALRLEPRVRAALPAIMAEPQVNWYDHPVRLGTAPEHNELLHGLRHLDEALDWEIRKRNLPRATRAWCALSVSVTHSGLDRVARAWLESELARAGGLSHLDLYMFTEEDTRRLLERALLPPAGGGDDAAALEDVFGVSGPYGRHYSFLKAVGALWQAVVDPDVRAVFKIDLDQVFPQAELEREAGGSMADLFRTPLWGARGTDADGAPLELGMIAGALVNERDIACGLFTPDVTCAGLEPVSHERLFWSRLPQALSTEAEMTARYVGPVLDGQTVCLQRVHVTGGTNGILIEALRRHRPFTPTFIGRAEDQAYLMSTFGREGPGLAYVHRPGLVMRHDKGSFAGEAIRAARAGKAVGDIVRVLQFSAYARALGDVDALKRRFDPFTGCFISRVPRAVALLRFALEALEEYRASGPEAGTEFLAAGATRLTDALTLTDPAGGRLERRLARERRGWAAFYEAVAAIGSGARGSARSAAAEIIRNCRVRQPRP
jgi:hypothetical protein